MAIKPDQRDKLQHALEEILNDGLHPSTERLRARSGVAQGAADEFRKEYFASQRTEIPEFPHDPERHSAAIDVLWKLAYPVALETVEARLDEAQAQVERFDAAASKADQLSEAMSRERDQAVEERDQAIAAREEANAERDKARADAAQAIKERDAAIEQRDAALGQVEVARSAEAEAKRSVDLLKPLMESIQATLESQNSKDK